MTVNSGQHAKEITKLSVICTTTDTNTCFVEPRREPMSTKASSLSLSLLHTIKIPLWPPCFYHFFRSCFGGHYEASVLAFEALQRLTEACLGQTLDAKHDRTLNFVESRAGQIMFTEPYRGSDGPCHVIFYYNHSWIVTFLGCHNIGGRSCSHDCV